MIDDIDTAEICRACGSDWKGKEILPECRSSYGGLTHYSRLIGIEIRGKYDGVLVWRCPDCDYMWHRFSGQTVYQTDLDAGLVTRRGVR